jgi:ketosteroid isomerase-like protein
VVIVADTAILTALVVDTVERGGRSQEFRMRTTQTWVRQGDDWVCLAGHAGPVE